jgi:hypothetical protein
LVRTSACLLDSVQSGEPFGWQSVNFHRTAKLGTRVTSLGLGMPLARDEHAERTDAGGGAMSDPIEASMDAAVARLAAAKARAEERDQASLAALLRVEGGQKAVHDELAAVRECLERIEKVLVQAGDPRGDRRVDREDGRIAHGYGAGKEADRHAPRLRRLLVAVAAVLGAAAAATLMGTPYWPWH